MAKTDYLMSFTAGELHVIESSAIATLYLDCHNWDFARQEAVRQNVLQVRSLATAKRYLDEIILRLKTFSEEELEYFVEADIEEQRLLLWVACCRTYKFIQNFGIEVLRTKYLRLEMTLTRSDINQFYYEESLLQPKLNEYSDQTRQKLLQRLIKLTKQAGLISDKWDIRIGFMTSTVVKLLAKRGMTDLMSFPLSDYEIEEFLKC